MGRVEGKAGDNQKPTRQVAGRLEFKVVVQDSLATICWFSPCIQKRLNFRSRPYPASQWGEPGSKPSWQPNTWELAVLISFQNSCLCRQQDSGTSLKTGSGVLGPYQMMWDLARDGDSVKGSNFPGLEWGKKTKPCSGPAPSGCETFGKVTNTHLSFFICETGYSYHLSHRIIVRFKRNGAFFIVPDMKLALKVLIISFISQRSADYLLCAVFWARRCRYTCLQTSVASALWNSQSITVLIEDGYPRKVYVIAIFIRNT